jgi:ubiquinone/menaquinone biosynthesis C-methylase UbiE
MGLYERFVFPWLCDLVLDQPVLQQQRHALLAGAGGRVLEIGFGTGLNLPHYPRKVHQLTAVDPSAGMTRRARRRIQRSGITVDLRAAGGEQLPFDDGAFDCVVSTLTLCSIDAVERALAEVYRVLRPGGRFLFLEHGLSPDPAVQKWQRRLNGLQQRLAGGCRLDRPIGALMAVQPFAATEVSEFYLERMPRTHGYVYRGTATK